MAAAAEVRGEQFLLVRNAVAVRVGVLPHLVGIRLHCQDGVGADRHREAREEQLVGEHRVKLEDTVVVAVLVSGDPPDRSDGIDPVHGLLVAAQLDDKHPSVAVEGDLGGRVDERVGEDRLEPVARRQPEARDLLGRRESHDRRFPRQVGIGVRRVSCVRGGTRTASTSGRLDGTSPAAWRCDGCLTSSRR